MPKAKTAITIDNILLEETDTIAVELQIPRSQVISAALNEYIQRYRNRQLFAQINEVFSDEPDSEDIENMQIIRSKHRKLAEHEEWK